MNYNRTGICQQTRHERFMGLLISGESVELCKNVSVITNPAFDFGSLIGSRSGV